MFTDQDIKDAKQVEPLDYVTRVSVRLPENNEKERRVPFFAPALVVFSLLLVTAPKGTMLETVISAYNSSRQFWSHSAQTPDSSSPNKQGDININARNSNVQNVQVINNNGYIGISTRK